MMLIHDSTVNFYLYNFLYRGKKIRVFAFGDYEYLTRMYGLSGPSGKHSKGCGCLWAFVESIEISWHCSPALF